MKKINFAKGQWTQEDLQTAYSFRFTETPDFLQNEDHIANQVNPSHREGFDNISLVTPETYGAGAKATLRCAFEGKGCPEIILVEQPEKCEDGALRYGACFEIVLYQGGVNIWRHYRENGKCFWHNRLRLAYPVKENQVHELTVEVLENYLAVTLNGQKTTLRTEDIFPAFHLGATVCEGIARLYDMTIE